MYVCVCTYICIYISPKNICIHIAFHQVAFIVFLLPIISKNRLSDIHTSPYGNFHRLMICSERYHGTTQENVINISLKCSLKAYNKLWSGLWHLVTCKLVCEGYEKEDCPPHGEARNENMLGFLLLFPVPGTLLPSLCLRYFALSFSFGLI